MNRRNSDLNTVFAFLAVCLSLALIALVTSCNEGTTNLKVAAYNVQYSKVGTASEIGEKLKPYNFDVVCFSEAPGGSWTADVAKAMGMNHAVVGRYSTAGHEDKYKSIASRTPLTDYEEVWMADTLHTVTRAITKIDDQEIAIYAVHFPFGWRDQAHIDETTGKVKAFIDYLKERQSEELSIAMGDFNFVLSTETYRSPYYEMFEDLGLKASWRDLGIDVKVLSSMHGVSEKRDTANIGRVIDHILYPSSRVKALAGDIIEMDHPLSDHKPVWALLEIKAN